MTVSVEDGVACVADSQFLAVSLTTGVVTGAAVRGEEGRCLDERPSPGIGTSVGDNPEKTAEVDGSELIWNW